MSVTSGFFNSLNGDRKYNATHMSSIFDGIINDGIYMSIGDNFKVKAKTGLNISVGTGRAWFNHTWTLNDSELLLTIEEPDLLNDRIDAVVLEINEDTSVRNNTIKIIKGIAATIPVNPTLLNTTTVHQYALAYVLVKKEATEVTQSQIANAVGTSATPFVTGIIETINIDDLIIQWKSQWNDWLLARETEHKEWTDEQKEIWTAWIEKQEEDFEVWLTEFTNDLETYKTTFKTDMDTFKTNSELDFNQWFQGIKNQLTEDAVGSLLSQIAKNTEDDFNRYYGLTFKETVINKDEKGTLISIIETSDEAVCTTTVEESVNSKTITTVIEPTDDSFKYTKVTVITSSENNKIINESYSKTAK